MKYCLFLAFIFVTNLAAGQIATIKKIEQTNPITKDKYVFPKISIQGFSNCARKINNSLRSEILYADSNIRDNQIFDKVWGTAKQSPTLSDLSYEVLGNNSSILSIKISAEGCGAYCESWDRYFVFNLKTGNQLHLDSMINAQGLLKLSKDFNSFKQVKLNDKIKEIRDTLKTDVVVKDKGSLDYYTEMLGLYTDCLDKKITYEYIVDLEFSFATSYLVMYSDRCSGHYNRNLDELWTFEYKIHLKNWVSYLTKYAKALVHM